jgi:sirohydrochlorin ferrochelatase
VRHPRVIPLVAVAHGSKDPRAAATIGELLDVVRARAGRHRLDGLDVRAAFLDHAAPSLRQVLSSLTPDHRACTVVPLLLTAAYHSKRDIPGQITAGRSGYGALDVACADTLGPSRLLLTALERRLAEVYTGPRRATSVVLAAAGSSDPAANETNAALAARWQATGGWRRVVVSAYASAGPSPADAVRRLAGDGPVVVATYLLAPGYFADRVRDTSLEAGAAAVSGALGAAPEIADIVLLRYASAVRAEESGPLAARA